MTYLGLKTCPQCDGTGECAYEEPVVDYQHGGYLQEVIDTCDRCGGTGEIEDWEDDDNE